MRDLRIVGTSAIAPALWGTTYLVTTELLPAHRPLLAGTLRALPAGLLLIGVVAVLSRALTGAAVPPDRSRSGASMLPRGAWWWRAPLLGTLNIGLFFALLFVAAYRLPGGVAAVVGAVGPFVVAGIAFVLLGERPARRTLVGAAVGIGGVALLVLRSSVALDPIGLLAAAGGTLSMSLGTVLGRRWGVPDGYPRRSTALLALTGWQLTAGGLLLLPATLVVEGLPSTLTAVNLGGFGYLSMIGTAFAYVLWFRGVTSLAPARVTLLALLSPAVAAMLGWVVLGQALSAGQVLGAVAVLGAVVLGTSSAGPRPSSAGPRPSSAGPRPSSVAPRPSDAAPRPEETAWTTRRSGRFGDHDAVPPRPVGPRPRPAPSGV